MANPSMAANKLYIPALGIYTSVVAAPVAKQSKGSTLVVPRPDKVGKWTGSSSYGAAAGTIVIAGHNQNSIPGGGNYRNGGALAPIVYATPGMRIWVSDAAARVYQFTVSKATFVNKKSLPAWVYYGKQNKQGTQSPVTMNLVTCDGVVRRSASGGVHHTDNAIISAVRTG